MCPDSPGSPAEIESQVKTRLDVEILSCSVTKMALGQSSLQTSCKPSCSHVIWKKRPLTVESGRRQEMVRIQDWFFRSTQCLSLFYLPQNSNLILIAPKGPLCIKTSFYRRRRYFTQHLSCNGVHSSPQTSLL